MIINLTVTADEADELLTVGFLNTTSGQTRTQLISTGQVTRIALDPGPYLVRVTLPSGELVSEEIEATDEAAPLDLTVAVDAQARDLLNGPTSEFNGPPSYAVDSLDWLNLEEESGHRHRAASEVRSRPLAGTWLRLWEFDDAGDWRVLDEPHVAVRHDRYREPRSRIYVEVFHTRPRQRLAAQIGGPEIPTRLVALPTTENDSITLIMTTAPLDGFEGGLAVRVRMQRSSVDSLLSYLTSSQFAAASAVLPTASTDAEELLYRKRADPNGAIVGGYFLLRVRAFDQLHDWPANLVRLASDLPDASLVRVGQILSSVIDESDREELRWLLSNLRGRAFPVYTEGLRWLMLGIQALGPGDLARDLLALFKPYADAVDWSSPFTQFWGNRPDNPGFDRYVGRAGANGTFIELSQPADLSSLVVNLERRRGDASSDAGM